MNITIICVGNIKEKYYKDALNEYLKRLSAYAKVEIVEVSEEKAGDKLSAENEKAIMQKEGERILAKIPKKAFVVTLEIGGKNLSSEQFASFFQTNMGNGVSDIVFIIGGSLGLSGEVKNASHLKLSFSNMTFPHQLMRVILCEQIYRAFKIMRNEPYHK